MNDPYYRLENLSPCRCGGAARLMENPNWLSPIYQVWCQQCGHRTLPSLSPQWAMDAWQQEAESE